MKCPDCSKDLSISRKGDSYAFNCGFCGLSDQIFSKTESEAYDFLVKKKSIRKIAKPTRDEEEPLIPRKTKEEKQELIEKGGADPDTLPTPVNRIIFNPDVELIYYNYLKKQSPPITKKQIDLPPQLKEHLQKEGISSLYEFQTQAFDEIIKGNDVVIVAPTGTGKTEAFLFPLLAKIWNTASHPLLRRGISALIIYPTKALAKDQQKKIRKYGKTIGVTSEIYDGDTPQKTREKILEYPPDILITNPDMLHFHLRNPQFREIIKNVKSIVIDEIHVAIGAFGSNLHFILKRLQRMVKHKIQFIGSSATIGNAKEFTNMLFDSDVVEISIKEARKAPTHLLITLPWGVSQYTITTDIARHLVSTGHKTLCFQNSHKNAEIINLLLRSARVKSSVHRAGLTREHRNRVEKEFQEGSLKALVSTPTLELGIDIGDVDGVVSSIVDITSFIQRLGRAGRKGQESVGVLVLRNDDPISTFYSSYPETYFEDIRKGYVEPKNEIVSYYQLLAAVMEKPLVEGEFTDHQAVLDVLIKDNLIRKTQKGTYRVKSKPEAMSILRNYSIRGIGDNMQLKSTTGNVLGERSMPMAARELHPGAIYLHGGKHFRSSKFIYDARFGGGEINIDEIEPVNFKTTATRYAIPTILGINEVKTVLNSETIYCDLQITENVVGYTISDIYKNKILEERSLEVPITYSFPTKGFMFTVPKPQDLPLKFTDISEKLLYSGTFHAVEHVLIESSSMLTGGGSAEIGGISMGESGVIFVYDAAKGGSGLSKLLYDRLEEGFNRSLKILQKCDCKTTDGCPKCTYSYQCGNNNQPLNKIGAIETLKLLGKEKLSMIDDFMEYQAYV
ncbi:MAG: DEAD/DEAH box helicase [Candidatus Heimdallarchaeaceae archaeon]|jgi:DEAD/DEAH box helicase domain-containing protein